MSDPSSRAIDFRDERVRRFVRDPFQCSAWEVLRRFHRPASAAELAQAIDREIPTIHAVLDRLIDLGLVVRLLATARIPVVRYRVACKAIVIGFDADDPMQVAELAEIAQRFRGRAEASRAPQSGRTANAPFFFECSRPATLSPMQLEQLRAMVRQVRNFLDSIANESRLEEGLKREPCTHHVEIDVFPCKPDTLPLPSIVAVDRENLPTALEIAGQSSLTELSPRERTVALALANGKSRPEIAVDLGLSLNTVATIGKRIYLKLGISRRAELVRRIRL